MAYITLPAPERKKTGLEAFSEGISPYLQLAMQTMLQRQMEERNRQMRFEQAYQASPELFAPVAPEITQQYGEKIPAKYLKFKSEGMKTTFNPITGETSFTTKEPTIYEQMMAWQGLDKGKGQLNLPPANIEEAKKQLIEQGENPADYSFEPVYSTEKGGLKVQTGITPKFDEQLQSTRLANEKQTQFILDSAKDTLSTIDKIKEHMDYFGGIGLLPPIPNTAQGDWKNALNKLLSGKIVEIITTMKTASKTGATGFGQLSEKEGEILRNASTELKSTSSPARAKEILEDMEDGLQKIIEGQSNINQTSSEWTSEKEQRLQELQNKLNR